MEIGNVCARAAVCAIAFLALMLVHCSDDSTGPNHQNRSPSQPRPLPSEVVLDDTGGLRVTLRWECEDPDGDSVTFDIYLGVASPPPLLQTDWKQNSYSFTVADTDSVVYWAVAAHDGHNHERKSDTWEQFIRAPFQYPLVIGASWTYAGQFILFNFDPGSLGARSGDTLHRASLVEVAALDTVPSGTEVYRLHEILTEYDEIFESCSYYENRKKGLFYHGTTSQPHVAPVPFVAGHTLALKGKRFASLELLVGYFYRDVRPAGLACGIDTVFHDPPLKSLQFPMRVGSQWTYRPPGNPWLIDKRINSEGPVEVPAGSFQAYEVQWLYDIDEDGSYDEQIDLRDQISYEGLLDRTLLITGIVMMDESGDTLGTFDIMDKWELTELTTPD